MAAGSPQTQTLSPLEHAVGTILSCDSNDVGVRVEPDHRRLVAIRPIAKGTQLFPIIGRETPVATRYSLQVSALVHVDQDCARDEFELVQRYFWRYMDHSCEPTALIRDRQVIAMREIAEGEGVTFHYNTTEYDMASPFSCYCGSARCMGMIRGAKHLSPAERAHLAPWLPDYLR